MSKKFSIKPQVEQLDIETDEGPVFVRQLTGGDAVRLNEITSKVTGIALRVRAKSGQDKVDPEEWTNIAQEVLTPEQFSQLTVLEQQKKSETVFLRWCTQEGKRRFTDRDEFNEVPAELVDAIYLECNKVDPDVGEAEGNSESPPD